MGGLLRRDTEIVMNDKDFSVLYNSALGLSMHASMGFGGGRGVECTRVLSTTRPTHPSQTTSR
jgi:hypothetical protein